MCPRPHKVREVFKPRPLSHHSAISITPHWFSKASEFITWFLNWKTQCLVVHQRRQNNLFLPVSMPTQDAFEVKGRETCLLIPLALIINSLLLKLWAQPKPTRRLWQTGSTTVCPFIQEGVLYLRPACSLQRSSNKKTTNNEQNRPLVYRSHSLSSWSVKPKGTVRLSHKQIQGPHIPVPDSYLSQVSYY